MYGWTENPTNFTAHRPWSLPNGPWIMAQRWSNLLFAHWPVDADALRAIVPPSLPLDTFDGAAWLSIVPFYLSHLRPRWLPALPWVSEFPELNVRTYVTLGGKPGIYFFSLDAASPLAVAGARATYHLPYFAVRMSPQLGADGAVHYSSKRTDHRGRPAEFRACYRPIGPVSPSAPGTLDHWLTERYCLYALDGASRIYRAEIHHRPWPLQPAVAAIEVNTMATALNIVLPATAPRLSFAAQLDVVVWAPERISE
jgi:uncharacterized protein YqjF (DUF2071 family)